MIYEEESETIETRIQHSKNFDFIKMENKQLYLEPRYNVIIEKCIKEAGSLLSKDITSVSFTFNNVYMVIRAKYTLDSYYKFYKMSCDNTDNLSEKEQKEFDQRISIESEKRRKYFQYVENIVPFVPNSKEYILEKQNAKDYSFLFDYAELVFNKTKEQEEMIYEVLGRVSDFQRNMIHNIIKDYFPQ
jgi:hypothetical protein